MSPSPTERFRRVNELFDAMLDLPADEQAAFIDGACGEDTELRAELLELLRAFHRSDNFLEAPAARVAAPLLETAAVLGGGVPEHIGAFRVVREIGRGGMGRVFLGERADGQFDQRVALKLIQHAAPGLVRRFIEERRILALLEHANIARLIDGGITAGGLPYFAMELVEGEPIDRYCQARELPLQRRLDLFITVCDAVSYAHQHLVIHRDLKPSNILITADGQVKLLDFGIAKLLGVDEPSADVTRTDFRVMTPEFAAPEQLRGTSVSTATDVYSLGVLLYMLVTGGRPYDVRGKSAGEVERIVCDEDVAKPSTRAPAHLRRQLRGDLDLIVMTALQKREERRYHSPAALAQDLQRYRAGHPIAARPDSTRYRLGKFISRHRVGVAMAAALLLALTGAASRERVLRTRAEVEARKAKEVEDFLVSVFDVADPYAWQAPDAGSISARELLDRGASRIDSTLTNQPEVQAELRSVLGRVYANLGLYDKATPLLERALAQRTSLHGPLHASVAMDMDLLGAALLGQDKYNEAEPLLRGALERRRRLFGNTHAETAETIGHLATLLQERSEFDAAEPLFREALAIRQALFGDTALEVAESLNDLGVILFRTGAYDGAEALYRRALDIDIRQLGEAHPTTAAAMQNLAQTLQLRGNHEEAEKYYRRSLAAKRKALGDAHPSVTISLNNLGNLLARQLGRLDEGEALTREAITLDQQIFGERHSYVAAGLTNLGVILRLKGEFAEADSLFREALAIQLDLFGEVHEDVALNYGHLAQTRLLIGDDEGAVRLGRIALAKYARVLGDDHLNTTVTRLNLGRALTSLGDPVEGESHLRTSLSRLDPQNRGHRLHFANAQLGLGQALLAQGRTAEALPVLHQALELLRERFGEEHWRTAEAQLTYGNALVATGSYADGAALLRAARVTLEKHRKQQPRLAAQAAAVVDRLAERSAADASNMR